MLLALGVNEAKEKKERLEKQASTQTRFVSARCTPRCVFVFNTAPLASAFFPLFSHTDEYLSNCVLQDEASTDRFVRFFAGETHAVGHGFGGGWATPYALSVYGSPMIPGDRSLTPPLPPPPYPHPATGD